MKANIGAAILGAIVGVIVGVVVGATALQNTVDHWYRQAAWKLGGHGSPTCSDPGYYDRIRPIGASANVTLSDRGGYYDAKYTFDDDRTTAWVEGNFGKHGHYRDAVSWQFSSRKTIKLICVENGFEDNVSTYNDSGLVRQLRVNECGAVSVHELDTQAWGTEGTFGFQGIRVNCRTDRIRLVITSISSAYQNGQVSLSEVRFYG